MRDALAEIARHPWRFAAEAIGFALAMAVLLIAYGVFS